MRFEDHPHSQAMKGKFVVLTLVDHKKLVHQGADIVKALNTSLEGDIKTFAVIGHLEVEDLRSFWFRVKYNYCALFFCALPS